MNDVIVAEKLTKSYKGLCAVDSLSLSVMKGTCFGLLGANGAGKSTTVECLIGTRTPDSGEVSLLGMNPRKERKKLFERVGVQFQDAQYQDKITVGEMCEVSASLYKNPAEYRVLLENMGLGDRYKSPVKDLSGGQKQRLFIILALIPNPEVVFLDELTTGLDARARRDIWKYIKELKAGGVTVFLTSHYMDEVEILCDRICILKHGRAVFTGTVAEMVSNSPYQKLEDAYLWYTEEEVTPEMGDRI